MLLYINAKLYFQYVIHCNNISGFSNSNLNTTVKLFFLTILANINGTNPVSVSAADSDSILADAIFLMTSKEHESDLRAMCKIFSLLYSTNLSTTLGSLFELNLKPERLLLSLLGKINKI